MSFAFAGASIVNPSASNAAAESTLTIGFGMPVMGGAQEEVDAFPQAEKQNAAQSASVQNGKIFIEILLLRSVNLIAVYHTPAFFANKNGASPCKAKRRFMIKFTSKHKHCLHRQWGLPPTDLQSNALVHIKFRCMPRFLLCHRRQIFFAVRQKQDAHH